MSRPRFASNLPKLDGHLTDGTHNTVTVSTNCHRIRHPPTATTATHRHNRHNHRHRDRRHHPPPPPPPPPSSFKFEAESAWWLDSLEARDTVPRSRFHWLQTPRRTFAKSFALKWVCIATFFAFNRAGHAAIETWLTAHSPLHIKKQAIVGYVLSLAAVRRNPAVKKLPPSPAMLLASL